MPLCTSSTACCFWRVLPQAHTDLTCKLKLMLMCRKMIACVSLWHLHTATLASSWEFALYACCLVQGLCKTTFRSTTVGHGLSSNLSGKRFSLHTLSNGVICCLISQMSVLLQKKVILWICCYCLVLLLLPAIVVDISAHVHHLTTWSNLYAQIAFDCFNSKAEGLYLLSYGIYIFGARTPVHLSQWILYCRKLCQEHQ